jgi:hypothetical protein
VEEEAGSGKEKIMLRNNIRVITFISIFLLFFAVSVYGPSVYAKMKVMEDDYLSQIEGEAGVTMGLNVTVRVVADTLKISNDAGEYIQSIGFGIDNGSGGNLTINSSTTQDVGTSGTRTWLKMTSPTIENMRVYASGLTVSSSTGTYGVGDLSITGIYMGSNVTTVTPNYIMGSTPYFRIGAHDGSAGKGSAGFDIYSEQAMYINDLTWTYATGKTVNVSGIYMYAANTNIPSGTPSGWVTLTGDMIMGSNGSGEDLARVDVGSNTSNGTILRISMPTYGSTRIRSFTMNGQNFGCIASDNTRLYTLNLTLRNLNSAGY